MRHFSFDNLCNSKLSYYVFYYCRNFILALENVFSVLESEYTCWQRVQSFQLQDHCYGVGKAFATWLSPLPSPEFFFINVILLLFLVLVEEFTYLMLTCYEMLVYIWLSTIFNIELTTTYCSFKRTFVKCQLFKKFRIYTCILGFTYTEKPE